MAATWAQEQKAPAPARGAGGPATSTPVAGRAATAAPKIKAIWEPVSVKDDLKLFSIRFVSPDEGWVAGGRDELHGGVVLHTKDGGATWETQLGNPKSGEAAFMDLRMVSATLGWVTQTSSGQDKLLQTTDGRSWAPVGGLPQHHVAYTFTPGNTGYVLFGRQILRSPDGGRNWRSSYRCGTAICEFESIFFLNENAGFALSRETGHGAGNVLAKTADGGATWEASVILKGQNGKESSFCFTTEKHGVIRMSDGKLFYTDDAGKTWTAAAGITDGKAEIQLTGVAAGWAVRNRVMSHTTDGGKHWLTGQIPFPNMVLASSLVSPDRGYVAGEHGMVYRYRVVPFNYISKGMLWAPLL
jgi:photosystem II stability/assembly factor-like uncharacterized protein